MKHLKSHTNLPFKSGIIRNFLSPITLSCKTADSNTTGSPCTVLQDKVQIHAKLIHSFIFESFFPSEKSLLFLSSITKPSTTQKHTP